VRVTASPKLRAFSSPFPELAVGKAGMRDENPDIRPCGERADSL
jgi:hypothetical protein